MTTSEEFVLLLHVSVPTRWSFVDPLRMYMLQLAEAWAGPSFAERASVCGNELLENASKFGDPSHPTDFELWMAPRNGRFRVVVANRALPMRIKLLKQALELLRGKTPEAAYKEAVARAANGKSHVHCFGLARVQMEARLQLVFDIDEQALLVRVVAEG